MTSNLQGLPVLTNDSQPLCLPVLTNYVKSLCSPHLTNFVQPLYCLPHLSNIYACNLSSFKSIVCIILASHNSFLTMTLLHGHSLYVCNYVINVIFTSEVSDCRNVTPHKKKISANSLKTHRISRTHSHNFSLVISFFSSFSDYTPTRLHSH